MIEAVEFLSSAKELLNKQLVKEVDYRNAASRAYYCAFHTCKKLLEDFPPTQSQIGAEHEKIINGLLNHQDKRFKALGSMLKDAKDQRVKADYRLDNNFTIQDAKLVVKFTDKILMEINK
jgi:uncharacterized protein (UPF0332 family)